MGKERSYKQVIIVRKDLNMRKGKMIAQGSHASLGAYLASSKEARQTWMSEGQTKIAVGVNSEEELIAVYNKLDRAGLNPTLIRDAGHTEFKEPTLTAVGVGPVLSEDVDPITGQLLLL